MAKAVKEKVNKSELIRKLLSDHPEAGPQEISKILKRDHNVDSSAAFVSTIKTKMKNGSARPATRRMSGASPSDVIQPDTLIAAKQFSDRLGGIKNAKGALDVLNKILSS